MASRDEIERVWRSYDAFNRRDLETFLDGFHPDAEWHPILADLGGGVYRGHEGIRAMLEEIDETWDSFRIELEKVHDAGERLLVFTRSRARGKASGLETGLNAVTLIELRDGRATRVWSYMSLEEALAAAGLEKLPAAAEVPDGYAERW
jgi:ketosteroid isomerase-like protein